LYWQTSPKKARALRLRENERRAEKKVGGGSPFSKGKKEKGSQGERLVISTERGRTEKERPKKTLLMKEKKKVFLKGGDD